jgi:DNA polymerase I-like protein with 3'-5' exonuclease and polymerase domains
MGARPLPVIQTANLVQGQVVGDNFTNDQVYNALDCALTLEIFEELSTLGNSPPEVYNFSRALQAPCLAAMRRGFLVDNYERQRALGDLRSERADLMNALQRMAYAVWDRGLNPGSTSQLRAFFYDAMRLPKQFISIKGVRKLSMNREVMEKLQDYFHAMPIAATILAVRDLDKQIQDFEQLLDSDGRYRTSFNIAGAETFRFSSSKSSTGSGGNLQNKKRDDDIGEGELSLRRPFIADPGYKLCEIDLEQAESREVGWLCWTLFGDESYLKGCESGDLHTTVCRMTWPDMAWTGTSSDRKIAEQMFYRNYSYRDMAKKLGHGCLTKGHEVLTRSGWVPIEERPEEILIWNPYGSAFERPSNWLTKEWNGALIQVTGTSIELEMTADHRVLYYKDPGNKLYETPAEKFPSKGFIPLGTNYIGGHNIEVTPDKARLIAAYQCDGYKSYNQLRFHFHKERKFVRLAKLATQCGFKFSRQNNKASVTWHNMSYPKEAGSYLLDWTKEAIDAYLDEHKHWDGHITETSQSISSVNRNHLEWLQTMGRLRGIGGNIQKPTRSGFGSTVYKLQQNNRKYATIKSLKVTTRRAFETQVYCPTVSTGAFYVRYNGKISITGNSNYFGTAYTMSRQAKIPLKLAQEFQSKYFHAFPGIPKWHRWVAQQLQTKNEIVNSFGVARTFFGRASSDETLREAIAHSPQSSTAMRTNLAWWRIWNYMPEVELLAQKHDSITFQFPDSLIADYSEKDIISHALALFSTPLHHNGRAFDVPGEAKSGWNWGKYDEKLNPDGMKKFKGIDNRKRHAGMGRIL